VNQEIKDKWVDALKSGQYNQCRRRLRIGNTFCCLGVLCDILDKEDWHMIADLDEDNIIFDYRGGKFTLPPEITKQVDLDPEIAGDLGKMNDLGYSFEEIAQFIDTKL
jgi:hypothetical protein